MAPCVPSVLGGVGTCLCYVCVNDPLRTDVSVPNQAGGAPESGGGTPEETWNDPIRRDGGQGVSNGGDGTPRAGIPQQVIMSGHGGGRFVVRGGDVVAQGGRETAEGKTDKQEIRSNTAAVILSSIAASSMVARCGR